MATGRSNSVIWKKEYQGMGLKIDLSYGGKREFLRINKKKNESVYKRISDLSEISQINDKSMRWGDPYEGTNYYIQMQLNSEGDWLENIRIIRKNEARRIPMLSGFFEGESFKVIPHPDKEFTYYTRCKKEEVKK